MSKQSEKFKGKEYVYSKDVEDLANKIIEEKKIEISPARIKYILVYPHINKKTAGRCIKCNNELRFVGECEYIIEISGDLWDKLKEQTKEILLWHELKHPLVVMNDKTGEWDFKLLDHDVKDFYNIIKEHGIDWLNELKTLASSVYDLEPKDLDGFKI